MTDKRPGPPSARANRREGGAPDWHGGHSVVPLIDGAETFAALEEAIRQAKKTVHMAYWVFDPSMETVDGQHRERAEGWDELLAQALEREVTVRIILADFDPIVAFARHEEAYAAYRHFQEIRAQLPCRLQGLLQVVTSRHPARVGLLFELLGRYITRRRLRQLLAGLNETLERDGKAAALERFGRLPGVWDRISLQDQGFVASRRHIPVYLGSHHEKICIVDSRVAYLGGLDVEPKRYDTPEHDTRDAWHDIACRLEGPVTALLEQHFSMRWNEELGWFKSFVEGLAAPQELGPQSFPSTFERLDPPDAIGLPATGPVEVMPLQTRSRSRSGWFHRTAEPVTRDIADFYRTAIARARDFIYIESQYFRVPDLARWIIKRAGEVPALQVILLLPLVSEVIATDGEPDSASQHGQHLQAKSVKLLRSKLGSRCGVFTLIRNGPAAPHTRAEARLHDSDLVYVHAKTAIFDDSSAIIGSANLNGRSFWCDTETAIAWRDPTVVRQYRSNLWQRLFRRDVADWTPDRFVENWSQLANANARSAPGKRQGFVVPLPAERLSLHARWHWIVPQANV